MNLIIKTLKNKYFIAAFVVALLNSCIVDTELLEIPKDFNSPENTFKDKAGFESALSEIYRAIRDDQYMPYDGRDPFLMFGYCVDFNIHKLEDDVNGNARYNTEFFWDTWNKDNTSVKRHWQFYYNWIFKTNVIINRAEERNISWTDVDKAEIIAEAKFLRAFAYHFLANCWGDVPLVLNETTSPKFDYVRAPQMEVYQQCKTDLTEATQYMKTVDRQSGGRAPRAAAYHLLSEINICLGDYPGAISAASAVINDPNYSLMYERFGVRKDFTFTGWTYQGPQQPWGDVYFDLFQKGNMNWGEGNRECIWNLQMDVNLPGGGLVNAIANQGIAFERWWGTGWWRTVDKNGTPNWMKDTLCGRTVGMAGDVGGLASIYVNELIWQYKGDWNRDIRNSYYNIQREFYWTNPTSEFYGQPILPENMAIPAAHRANTTPSIKKFHTTVHYGFQKDALSGENHDGGRVFKDWYIMRMPETYLLRAEAYLRSGDTQKSADDINVVRSRAKATPVTASDVDLDLILDERARELFAEEFRTSTLMRMGKFVEYLHKYNGYVIQNNFQLPTYLNLFPIPQSEIEANKGSDLGQNPGYE